jgi:hypothetical protein
MILDFTNTESQETLRFKPRNKASCKGVLKYDNIEIASIRNIAIAVTPSLALVGGTFSLEWHRMNRDDLFEGLPLSIEIEYEEVGKLPKRWLIPDIQLMYEGSVLAVQSLTELIGSTIVFFAHHMEYL